MAGVPQIAAAVSLVGLTVSFPDVKFELPSALTSIIELADKFTSGNCLF